MTCPNCLDCLRVPFDAPGGLTKYVTCWECERGQRVMGIGPYFHGLDLKDCGAPGATLRAWDGKAPGWYLHGLVGRGKTSLAAAACRHQAARGLAVRFLSSARLLDTIKATFDGNPADVQEAARLALARFAEAEVVVLDDLGVELATEWAESELTRWIDGFYERNAALVVTSNLAYADLGDRLGQRIASRVVGMTEPLELTGPDRRMQRQRQPRRPASPLEIEPEPTAEEYAAIAARWLPKIQGGIADAVNGKTAKWAANGHRVQPAPPASNGHHAELRPDQRTLLETMVRDGREDDIPGRFRAYIPEIREALGRSSR